MFAEVRKEQWKQMHTNYGFWQTCYVSHTGKNNGSEFQAHS